MAVYPHAATDMAKSAWLAWNRDLTSLHVQNVATLQVGVDGSNATGMTWPLSLISPGFMFDLNSLHTLAQNPASVLPMP